MVSTLVGILVTVICNGKKNWRSAGPDSYCQIIRIVNNTDDDDDDDDDNSSSSRFFRAYPITHFRDFGLAH